MAPCLAVEIRGKEVLLEQDQGVWSQLFHICGETGQDLTGVGNLREQGSGSVFFVCKSQQTQVGHDWFGVFDMEQALDQCAADPPGSECAGLTACDKFFHAADLWKEIADPVRQIGRNIFIFCEAVVFQ